MLDIEESNLPRLSRNRAFLSLWFAKPMLCMQVAFHENDGNRENDEDNSDSHKQGVECCISGNHSNHGNDENHVTKIHADLVFLACISFLRCFKTAGTPIRKILVYPGMIPCRVP